MHNNPVPRKVTALEEHALQLKKLSEEQDRIKHHLLEARVTSFCADGTTSRWIQVYGRGDHGCVRGFVVNNKRRERSCRDSTGRIAFSATGPPKSCSKTVAGTNRRRWKYAFTPYSSKPTRAASYQEERERWGSEHRYHFSNQRAGMAGLDPILGKPHTHTQYFVPPIEFLLSFLQTT